MFVHEGKIVRAAHCAIQGICFYISTLDPLEMNKFSP